MSMFSDMAELEKECKTNPLVLTAKNGTKVDVPFEFAADIAPQCPGYCLACGEYHDGVEPDACHYQCEACGESEVYGASELVIMGEIS